MAVVGRSRNVTPGVASWWSLCSGPAWACESSEASDAACVISRAKRHTACARAAFCNVRESLSRLADSSDNT